MSTLQPRLTALASTLAAGSALASAAMIGGVPAAPVHSSPLFDTVQRNVALTGGSVVDTAYTPNITIDTNTFGGSLQWLLDMELKVGAIGLPHLIDPKNNITLEHLLSGSGLGISSSMDDLFTKLGLQNFKMGQILGDLGLPASSTVDDILGKLGMGTATLDSLIKEFGFSGGAGETLAQVVTKIGMGNVTVDKLMSMVGFPGSLSVDNLMNNLGLGNLQGLLGVTGVTSSTDLANMIGMLGSHAGSLTLSELMNAAPTTGGVTGDGFLSSIGGMSFGQLLGFKTSTTLESVLNGLHFTSTATMGNTTLTEIIGLVAIKPSMTLSGLLDALPLGTSGHANLGTDTLGEFFTHMTQTPTADVVTDTTTLQTLFTDMGMGSLTLDTLLGLPT